MMSERDVPVVFEGYPPDKLARMVTILERAADGRPVDASEVEDRLIELIHAIGLAREDTEHARLWHELQADLAPDHAHLRDRFKELAAAENPLDPILCARDLAPYLQGQIRTRWSPRWKRAGRGEPRVSTLDWHALTPVEQDELRSMCRHLAHYHGSFVRCGRQQKNDLDTIIYQLAECFLRWTDQQIAVEAVPYSMNSHFIAFAVEALKPVRIYFEVSQYALSRRWERYVRHARTGWPPAKAFEASEDGK